MDALREAMRREFKKAAMQEFNGIVNDCHVSCSSAWIPHKI
jgi:hypothetical protein